MLVTFQTIDVLIRSHLAAMERQRLFWLGEDIPSCNGTAMVQKKEEYTSYSILLIAFRC